MPTQASNNYELSQEEKVIVLSPADSMVWLVIRGQNNLKLTHVKNTLKQYGLETPHKWGHSGCTPAELGVTALAPVSFPCT